MAKFKVKETFKITGKGFSLTGDILEGEVFIGSKIKLSDSEIRVVIGIEAFSSINNKINRIALLIPCSDEEDLIYLLSLNLNGQLIEIENNSN